MSDCCKSIKLPQMCCLKPSKRNNKGLVTFDKKNYFPLIFLESSIYHRNDRDGLSEGGKRPDVQVQTLKNNIAVAICEDESEQN